MVRIRRLKEGAAIVRQTKVLYEKREMPICCMEEADVLRRICTYIATNAKDSVARDGSIL